MRKPAAAAAERASPAELVKRLSQPPSAQPAAGPVGLTHSKSEGMKGLFKPKPRTPTDVVRQTRDLLISADRSSSSSSDPRDTKREEKVIYLRIFFFFFVIKG